VSQREQTSIVQDVDMTGARHGGESPGVRITSAPIALCIMITKKNETGRVMLQTYLQHLVTTLLFSTLSSIAAFIP
jgi:hypothetical protein